MKKHIPPLQGGDMFFHLLILAQRLSPHLNR